MDITGTVGIHVFAYTGLSRHSLQDSLTTVYLLFCCPFILHWRFPIPGQLPSDSPGVSSSCCLLIFSIKMPCCGWALSSSQGMANDLSPIPRKPPLFITA